MDQPTEERLAAYWALTRDRIRQEAALGNLNTLDVTVESCISTSTVRCRSLADTPERLDDAFHFLWFTVLLAAQNYHAETPKQDTLVRHVLYARQIGNLSLTSPRTAEKPTLARVSNGQSIWADLPLLAQDIFELYDQGLIELSMAHRINVSSFVARLVSVGACGDVLTGCVLLLFRTALEIPRRSTASSDGSGVPIQELLPAIEMFLRYAPHQMANVVEQSFCGWDEAVMKLSEPGELAILAGISSNGFSASRWGFWKSRLVELGHSGVMVEADTLVGFMEQIDHRDV